MNEYIYESLWYKMRYGHRPLERLSDSLRAKDQATCKTWVHQGQTPPAENGYVKMVV